MNKKGGVASDLIIIAVIGIIFIFVVLFTYKFVDDFKQEVQQSETLNTTTNINLINDWQRGLKLFDGLFAFLLVGLTIGGMVGAFRINTHWILFWISWILLAIMIIIAAQLSNFYEELSENPQMADTAAYYPIMNYIGLHYPWFIALMGILLIIATYTKITQGGAEL